MSTGTVIIERALQVIGAHSIASPADPESIVLGMEKLNSMLEMWLTDDIKIGTTPLEVPGDELNEPSDTRNGIINNLAIELAPDFDNGKIVVSPQLTQNVRIDFIRIEKRYGTISIPKRVVSSTLPRGAGNNRGFRSRTFFSKGSTING